MQYIQMNLVYSQDRKSQWNMHAEGGRLSKETFLKICAHFEQDMTQPNRMKVVDMVFENMAAIDEANYNLLFKHYNDPVGIIKPMERSGNMSDETHDAIN